MFLIAIFFAAVSLSGLVLAKDTRAQQRGHEPTPNAQRPVTVEDTIRMTKLGYRNYYVGGSASDAVAQFSPDASKFVVVLRKGNLENNTNEFQMLLWKTSSIFTSSDYDTVLTMASSSNRDAIADIKWLDNYNLLFLGEHPGGLHQVFRFNVRTRILGQVTNSPTNIISYSASADGKTIAYVAEQPAQDIFDTNTLRTGFVVSTEYLPDLIRTTKGGTAWGAAGELYVKHGADAARRIEVTGQISDVACPVSISPDGRHVVLPVHVASVPRIWTDYTDPYVLATSARKLQPGEFSDLQRLELIDAAGRDEHPLMNSPVTGADLYFLSSMLWSSDGRSLALGDLLLPLEGVPDDEKKIRQSARFAAEVNVINGEVARISDKLIMPYSWTPSGDLVYADESGAWWDKYENYPKVVFHKTGSTWQSTNMKPQMPPDITLREDMHTRPKIYVTDPSSGKEAMLLDLNPQFDQLKFGRVEEISWKSADGKERKGGIYYPVDYVAGKRYPLVIQTHLWSPNKFWIDGPFTTSFAAQPLAGKGIMVLQEEMGYEDMGTHKEIEREATSFDSAIDFLSTKGLVDPERVGLIGFSRTCWHVTYALIHSKYRFAAASVSEGVDGGYWQYLELLNVSPAHVSDFEGVNGGPPFGEGMKTWLERSPGFSIEKVRTPVLIVALNPGDVLYEWQWFAGLSRLHKPVELTMLQDGEHELEKPWERMVSQGGNVDWFAFWLKGEEDTNPAKAQQYTRWRQMRSAAAP